MTLIEANPSFPREPNHLGELALRRFRAGEFSIERCAEVEQHIAGCGACRGKLRGLVEEQRSFERDVPFERFAGGVERAWRVPRPGPRRVWTLGLTGLLAAVSIDELGEVTPLYPEAGPALSAAPTQETTYLPDSIEFTGAGRERVFLFLARNPFDSQAAKQAVLAGYAASKGDLDALPSPAFTGGQDVFSWSFRKP